jgi:hypothetical protein
MYYDTPNLTIYLKKVIKHRVAIIAATLLAVAVSVWLIKPDIVSSDTQFWLTDSAEMERTAAVPLAPHFTTKLKVYLGRTLLDGKKLTELKVFEVQLAKEPGVRSVRSIFSQNHIYQTAQGESQLLRVADLGSLSLAEQKSVIREFYPLYEHYVSPDYRSVYFYLNSDTALTLDAAAYGFDVEVIQERMMDYNDYLLAYALIVAVLLLLLWIIFRSVLAPVAALLIVAFTLIFTVAAIQIILPGVQIHIAMTLITIGIALLDFLYIYYRWHVNKHTKGSNLAAINVAVSKNIKPALWTTVTTLLGIGTLLFIDSQMIRLLSLSAVLASVIAYGLNFTFLPAFMSYFKAETKQVVFSRFSRFLANREIHYNKGYLYMFLLVSTTVGIIAFYEIFSYPSKLFANKQINDMITLEIPVSEIGVEEIALLEAMERELTARFDGVSGVHSLASMLTLMRHMEGEKAHPWSVEEIDRYRFLIELYGTQESVLGEESMRVTITFEEGSVQKAEAILYLREFAKAQNMALYFMDIDSLLSVTKHDNTLVLGASLLTALLMIGIIMGFIIKDGFMVAVAIITNAVPIVWFTLVMLFLHVPISLEILIAMTMTVGLASDATIHFVYKYYISRHFKKTKKEALESVFFYAGGPVVIGSLYLAVTFAALAFSGITTLELIGKYAGVLILMSLITDLFILPVLLLFTDHFAMDYRARRDGKREKG